MRYKRLKGGGSENKYSGGSCKPELSSEKRDEKLKYLLSNGSKLFVLAELFFTKP